MNIKVISFDIFQTLVDVNKRIPQIWKAILQDKFTIDNSWFGAKTVLEVYPSSLSKALNSNRFHTMEEVYYDCAVKVIAKTGFDVAPDTMVQHILDQHSKAPVYDDVLSCMKKLRSKYKIILSSDSNHTMIDDLLHQFYYDDLFISDDLKSYKANYDGEFFHQVIKHIGITPEQILHIGDSSSDVFGASLAGINSCWLNRDEATWKHDTKPIYIIKSLSEIPTILEMD